MVEADQSDAVAFPTEPAVGVDLPFGHDENHGHLRSNEGDGAMFHLRGGQAFGVNIGNFLEFERPFQSDRELVAAAQEEPVFPLAVEVGDLADGIALAEDGLNLIGNGMEGADVLFQVLLGHMPAAGDIEGHHGQNGDLAGEGLGGGDADFRAYVQVDAGIGFPGDGAADGVDNTE
ncbi:MAG: hypothetical protein BWY71_01504 [Planctomycetes bacterium ADurb.Bin412]|nr:MAG: hypothetical protein BWY71_01504 [Planctomycetes bacterium ADurb.Bin412]